MTPRRRLRRLLVTAVLAGGVLLGVTAQASASVYGVYWSNPSPQTAGASAFYDGYFDTNKALTTSDTITLSAPAGTVFPSAASDYTVVTGMAGYAVLSDPTVSNGGSTVTIPVPTSVPAGAVTVWANNTTNPTHAGGYEMTVWTSQETTPVSSGYNTYSITAAAPAAMQLLAGSPQSAAIGNPFDTAPKVQLFDRYGNAVSGQAVTFTAPSSGPSGTFPGGGTPTNTESDSTNGSGIATASRPTAGMEAGNYAITATAGSTSVTFRMDNTPGAPSAISLQLVPSSIPADGVSTTTAIATVTDAGGNPLKNWVPTLTAPGLTSGGFTDNGDGTYTATITSSTTPGSVVIQAGESGGTHPTDSRTLTLQPIAPGASTGSVSSIGTTAATLAGSVNPHHADTHYHFIYGVSTAYGASTPSVDAGSGATAGVVSAVLSGLQPSTTYHYRLVSSSAGGTTLGSDRTFTTVTPPPPPPSSGSSGASSTTSPTISTPTNTSTSKSKVTHRHRRRTARCHVVRRHGKRVRVCAKPRKAKHTKKRRHG